MTEQGTPTGGLPLLCGRWGDRRMPILTALTRTLIQFTTHTVKHYYDYSCWIANWVSGVSCHTSSSSSLSSESLHQLCVRVVAGGGKVRCGFEREW